MKRARIFQKMSVPMIFDSQTFAFTKFYICKLYIHKLVADRIVTYYLFKL